MPDLPLDDVRVIDLTTGLAGPICTKMLAELGADVIKVEPLAGDDARRFGPFAPDRLDLDSGGMFVYLNLNKGGVTLNLETVRGRQILRRLCAQADLLVESFPPGYLDRLGLDHASLAAENPSLIVTSISNFGATGSYRDYQATDLVLYALGGMMYVSGVYERHPLTHAYDQAQRAGGMNGAVASLAALHYQRETGQGQRVDVSIFECVVTEVQLPPARYSYTGGVETRGPRQRSAFVKGFIPVKDGYVGLNASGRNPWERFAEFLGVPELTTEKFNTGSARTRHAEELNALLHAALKDRDKDDFWHDAVANHFTFQVVQRPEETLDSPQLRARGFFVEAPLPRGGTLTMPGDIYGFSETPWQIRRSAPLLGQHNLEIYAGELGYDAAELSLLRQSGVI